MAFTKIAAAGIGSTGTITLQHVVVTGSVETPVITGAASTANVSANSLVVSGVSTLGSVVATTGTFSGNVSIAGTLTYEDVTNIDSIGLITARSGIRVNSGGLVVTAGVSTLGTTSVTNLSTQTLNVTGISTFSNNPVLIGSGTSTGTASQTLQVTGGAYVSGNLGIGVTNNTSHKLRVNKDLGTNNYINDAQHQSQFQIGRVSDNKSLEFAVLDNGTSVIQSKEVGVGYNNLTLQPNGNVFIGSLIDTGTASQKLQVTGGAYISGSVGLGTINPSTYKMVIYGTNNSNEIRQSDGNVISQWYQDNNGIGYFGTVSNHPQVFRTGGTDRVTIDTSGNVSVSGAISATGQIISTKANSTTTGGGQIYLNGATGNRIDFNQNGVAAPTFTTRSAGTKLVLYPSVGPSNVDYAFGIENNTLWSSVPDSGSQFKWYAGTTNIATLSGSGNFSISGGISASQYNITTHVPIQNGTFSTASSNGTVAGTFTLSVKSICLFSFNGTTYRGDAGGMTLTLSLNGIGNLTSVFFYTNEGSSHKSSPTGYVNYTLNAGTYTVVITSSHNTDNNDRGNCSVLAIPTP